MNEDTLYFFSEVENLYTLYRQVLDHHKVSYKNLSLSDLRYLLVYCALFRYIELKQEDYAFFKEICTAEFLSLTYGQTAKTGRKELTEYIAAFEKAQGIEDKLLSDGFTELTERIGEALDREDHALNALMQETFQFIDQVMHDNDEKDLWERLQEVLADVPMQMDLQLTLEERYPAFGQTSEGQALRALLIDNDVLPSLLSAECNYAFTMISSDRSQIAVNEILRIIRKDADGSSDTTAERAAWFRSIDEFTKLNRDKNDSYQIVYARISGSGDSSASVPDDGAETVALLQAYAQSLAAAFLIVNREFLTDTSDGSKKARRALLGHFSFVEITCSRETAFLELRPSSADNARMVRMIGSRRMGNNGRQRILQLLNTRSQRLFSDGTDEIQVRYDIIEENDYDLSMERYMTDSEKESAKIRRLNYRLMNQFIALDDLIAAYEELKKTQ